MLDFGYAARENYAINIPRNDGMDDDTYWRGNLDVFSWSRRPSIRRRQLSRDSDASIFPFKDMLPRGIRSQNVAEATRSGMCLGSVHTKPPRPFGAFRTGLSSQLARQKFRELDSTEYLERTGFSC